MNDSASNSAVPLSPGLGSGTVGQCPRSLVAPARVRRQTAFRVEPRDIPPEMAARRLGKTLADFTVALPRLTARGFPSADPDTGNYDICAIDRWCDARHPHLWGSTAPMLARDAATVARDRIAKLRQGTR